MKYLFPLLFLSMGFSPAPLPDSPEPTVSRASTSPSERPTLRWDYLSAGAGLLGLGLAFVPYLSLLGVMLGAAAIGFSIRAFYRKQSRGWAWLGMITGGLTVLTLLSVYGLIVFF